MATSETMAPKHASVMQNAGGGLPEEAECVLRHGPAVVPARPESAELSLLRQFTIANAITTASLVAGLSALLIATQTGLAMPAAKLRLAVGLICLAAFLDAIDGPIARYTHTSGPFGCNLDSLADVVSFGVAPAVVLYLAQLHRVPVAGVVASAAFCTCGAMRLARFPLCQSSEAFVGCPVPLAAVLAVLFAAVTHSPIATMITVAVLSYLMVGTLPFPTWSSIVSRSREASQR